MTDLSPDESLDMAMLRADQLLYQAKRRGRARCEHAFEEPDASRPSVLIAEDDPILARLLLHDLADDFEVVHVPDGDAALARAQVRDFDLILLDYQMPGRNGPEVIRELRGIGQYRTKPMLLLTAMGSDAAVEAAFDAGADDYISKPHTRRALLARLGRHLGRAPRSSTARDEFESVESVDGASAVSREVDVTVLFCDISEFVEMSASMSPSEVVSLLEVYFPVLAEIIARHQGRLEKYIGDAIFAVWGTPIPGPDDARRALLAAVEMQAAVARLEAQSGRPVRVHIGLHTGPVAVCQLGDQRYQQTATIGHTTNLASRICALAESNEIALSGVTLATLGDTSDWDFEGPELQRVRGHDEPIRLYRLRCG